MKLKKVITYLLLTWVFISIYSILHQAGHFLAIILFKGKVTYFSINPLTHVNYLGTFSSFQESIIHISGFAFPYLIWLFLLFFTSQKTKITVKRYIQIYSAIIMGTIIPWIIIPLSSSHNNTIPTNNITKFINTSNFSNSLILFFSLSLFIVSLFIWFKKIIRLKKSYPKKTDQVIFDKKMFKKLLIASIVFLLLMSFPWIAVNDSSDIDNYKTSHEVLNLDSYELIAQKELNNDLLSSLDIGEFKLSTKEEIEIKVVIENLSASFLNLMLIRKEQHFDDLIFDKEIKGAEIDIYQRVYILEEGTYQIKLNGKEIKGDLFIYFKKN
ncbi:MAG: hypothetical protein ACOCRX_02290 [Candidatus Woesearchaeota archaeon]